MDVNALSNHSAAHSAEHGVPRLDSSEFDLIERDLADVQLALTRLDGGTYWTCEVTGRVLPDDLLAESPAMRRFPAAD